MHVRIATSALAGALATGQRRPWIGVGALMAIFLPHAMITISGTAVTRQDAAAIARSLRPL